MKTAFIAALACAALCVGCSPGKPQDARSSWKRVELPGFSVVLPPGELVGTSDSPSAGKHQLKLAGSALDHWLHDVAVNGSVAAEWSSQSDTREEWTATYLPMMIAALDGPVPGTKLLREEQLDEQRWLAVLGKDRIPLALGVVRCDESFEVEITYAHYHLLEPQLDDMRAILRSVRCHVTEENRARPQVATRLPAKFGAVDSENFQFYRSLDGEIVVLNFTTGDINRDPEIYRMVIKALLSTTLKLQVTYSRMTTVSVPAGLHAGAASLQRVSLPATGETLYVGAVYCERQKQSLVSIWSAPHATDALALERLGQVGCADAPSTPPASFDSLVDSACRSGNEAACDLKAHPEG